MKAKSYTSTGLWDEIIQFAAWDTETKGLGGELLAVSAFVDGESYYYTGSTMADQFIALFFSRPYPYVWYAHHAQYDWRYVIPRLVELGHEVQLSCRTDTDIYQVVVRRKGEKGKWVMRDSLALLDMKLEELLAKFTPELPKLELDLEHVTFDPANPAHEAYARRDSEGLATALPRVDSLLREHFGVGVGHTAAGTSVKAWRATIPPGVHHNGSKYGERELFVRQAYYGGLVFLTRSDIIEGEPGARTYDRNSSYPAVMMQQGVPSGRMLYSREYRSGLMGIYRVRVKTPDDLVVPILPCRDNRGSMRWRRGTFDTVVTSSEVIFAANHGYKILRVYEGFAWEERIFPFDEFVAKCRDIRKEYKGLPLEFWAKLLQNSLYGRFGSRRERLRIFHPESDLGIAGAVPLEQLDYFWMRKELDKEILCRPEWAVFITAHARLALLQPVYTIGPENVIYGDTDSITVLAGKEKGIDVGSEYGQWKLEKEWRSFRALGPKLYTGQLLTGERRGSAKGLARKAMDDAKWKQLLETGSVQTQALSLASLRVGLAKGLEPARVLPRKSSRLENSGNWERYKGVRIRPKMAA